MFVFLKGANQAKILNRTFWPSISTTPHIIDFFRHKYGASSRRWIDRQASDFYSRQSVADGYKSRAAYKLLEINRKFNIINKFTKNIVDLGFAPGAWTQVALAQATKMEIQPRIVGVDLIDCAPLPGSHFVQGDIFSRRTHSEIDAFFEGEGVDVILSDMMSNATGHGRIDHFTSMDICEGVLILTDRLLRKNGSIVMKYFTGSLDGDLHQKLGVLFRNVHTIKPKACRQGLREVYVVARGKKLGRPAIVDETGI